MEFLAPIASSPLFWSGCAVGAAATAAYSIYATVFAFPKMPSLPSRTGSSTGAATRSVVLYELEHRPRSVGSLSGFCLAVEAHLNALGVKFERLEAFKDKMPPRGKAPFLEHTLTDGTVVAICESDEIDRYLLEAFDSPTSRILADAAVADASRRTTVRLLKRLATDRLYFVGMYAAVVPGAWSVVRHEGGMPWPFADLFGAFLRRSMYDQCCAAAGGIGRMPLGEALRSAEGDLDSVEEAVGRLASGTGFLSGMDKPCSSEVAAWAHLVPCVFERRDSPLGAAVAARPETSRWLRRVAEFYFPDRVRAALDE